MTLNYTFSFDATWAQDPAAAADEHATDVSEADAEATHGEETTLWFRDRILEGPRPIGGAAGKWNWRRSRFLTDKYGLHLDYTVKLQVDISIGVLALEEGDVRRFEGFSGDDGVAALCSVMYRAVENGFSGAVGGYSAVYVEAAHEAWTVLAGRDPAKIDAFLLDTRLAVPEEIRVMVRGERARAVYGTI